MQASSSRRLCRQRAGSEPRVAKAKQKQEKAFHLEA